VAVAWYQASRGNAVGTERQLEKAHRRLLAYVPSHRALDVAGVLHSVTRARGTFPSLPAPVVGDALPGGPDLERALAFMADLQERSAVERTPFRFGHVYGDPERPALWDLNFARLERPVADVDPDEVASAVDEIERTVGHRHRKLFVADPRAAVALEPRFRTLGWRIERYLVMGLVAVPGEGAHPVLEVDDAALVASRRAFAAGEDPNASDDVVAQLADFAVSRRRAVDIHLFAHVEGNLPVSWCELYSGGGVGQVEDVATLREHRGRGFASSVVARAARASVEAGHDLTFLVVDEDDGPVVLYERLGFSAVGREYAFFKPPL